MHSVFPNIGDNRVSIVWKSLMQTLPFLLKKQPSGFSLAELLITLAIMGIIAAFTIPSLFSNRADSRYTGFARDVAFMMLNAYERYKLQNPTVGINLQIATLTPYMNYTNIDLSSSSKITLPLAGTWTTGTGNVSCGTQYVGNQICYRLHNGGVIWSSDLYYLGGYNSTNALWFNFDPDGSGPSESLQIWLTYDGHIYTAKTLPTTVSFKYIFSPGTQAPVAQDASWFTGF